MLLKFTNRNTMALNQMVEQGKRAGGIPHLIEVNATEAAGILQEICTLPKNAVMGYSITDTKDNTSMRMMLTAKQTECIPEFVEKWRRNEWNVQWNSIPLIVITPTPQNQQLHD